MKLKLLKSWEHGGQKFEPDQYEYIEISDDDAAKQLIDEGIAEKFVETSTGKAEGAGDENKTGPLTAEEVKSIVDGAFEKQSKTAPPRIEIVGEVIDRDPKRGFKDLDHFLLGVCKYYGTGEVDKRLKSVAGEPITKAIGDDEQRTIYDPVGGFLIPDVFSNTLLSIPPEEDPIGSRTSKIRMSSSNISIPVRADKDRTNSVSGGFNIYWVEETAAIPTSLMKFERIKLEAHELCGAVHVTEKLLRDSPISVVDLISRGFRDEYIVAMTEARLFGTGAGQPLGIFNSGCLLQQDWDGTAGPLTDEIISMREKAWRYSRCVWMANHDALSSLIKLRLEVASAVSGVVPTTSAVYQTALTEDRPDMLLGRPIIYTEYLPTFTSAGLGGLVLADWGEYIDATRQDLQTATSIHVRFLNNEQTFRFTMSFDGMPWMKTPITPRRGANQLSPFIALNRTA